MLFSIETARLVLSTLWLVMSGIGAMAMAIFLLPLFPDLPKHDLLVLMALAAGIGLVIGTHFTFRAEYGTVSAFFRILYFLLAMEFLLAGGTVALAMWVAKRFDLCWFAFHTNSLAMIVSLLLGMYREADALEFWGRDTRGHWRSILDRYIDYATHQVSPSIAEPATKKEAKVKFSFWLIAAGITNIPLLFELYGGGRNNVIYFAAPIMTGVLAYLNLKHGGPGIARLLLLRKLEKEAGHRFINADLEQIQELRRTFFLSRWLMKDYARFIPISTPPVSTQAARQKKNRKRV